MNLLSSHSNKNILEAASCLKSGNLVVFPTETVYGLGADATNERAINRIYSVKGRPNSNPLIVHISSASHLGNWATKIPDFALVLAEKFWPGPLTLIFLKTALAKKYVTADQDTVAIRVPSNPIAQQLIKKFEELGGNGIAAPSANRSGKVSPTSVDAAIAELQSYLSINDMVIDGGDCELGIESSIIDCTGSYPHILRPGNITAEKIHNVLRGTGLEIHKNLNKNIRTPGMLESHYAPHAQIYFSNSPAPGDGFIAYAKYLTPKGVIRLAAPENIHDYARTLYSSLRLADTLKLEKICVIPPRGSGIATAIRDRLSKAACRSE